jgi:hypothetical protein
LSDFDVSDDEMPVSQPRRGGSGPYDGRDLDGLLSGGNVIVPEGLRPVARALDALRVAPMRAELAGEAAARAAFRQIMVSSETGSAWPATSVSGADDARPLILPTQAAGTEPRPAAHPQRHRHRRPPQRGRWQAKVLVAAAAAVVLGGAAVLASTLFSSGGHSGQAGQNPSAVSSSSKASVPGPRVEGTGKRESAAKPTPTATSQSGTSATPDPAALCSQYFAFAGHPGSASNSATKNELYRQLSVLAHGQRNVNDYCARLLEPWAATPHEPDNFPGMFPGMPGPGSPPFNGSQGGNSPTGHGGIGNSGTGNSGTGNGNVGNQGGPGRNNPGFGGQNH